MHVDVRAWLIFMSFSALLCGISLFTGCTLSGFSSVKKNACFSVLSLGLGILCGLLCGKLLYILFRFSAAKESFFSFKPEALSYYGGLAGVCLGVAVAARLLRFPIRKVLNVFAFSLALLAALIRFAEYWLGYLGTGGLDILFPGETDGIVLPFPFAMTEVFSDEYAECYLAVFMLEGILSLRVAVFALQSRKDALCFIRTVFYLCLFQILCESMRDISLRWLFVRYEQLLCYLIAEGILIWYGIVAAREHKWNFSASIIGLLVLGLTVAEEYMLDGKIFTEWQLPRIAVYIFMFLGLCEMMIAEHYARKKIINYPALNPCVKP